MPRPRKIVTAEERRALLLRRGELTALAQHPSWPVYEASIREAMDEVRRKVISEAMSDRGISLERQAYYRGVIRGMRTSMNIPVLAEERLDEYLSKHEESEEASG